MTEGDKAELLKALLEKRKIYLDEYLDENLVENIKKIITYLSAKDEKKEIVLYITGCDGEVESTLMLYNFIRHSITPIIGIVTGKVSYMSLVILQGCKKRIALRGSTFSFHYIIIFLSGVWNEFLDYAKEITRKSEKHQEEIFKILGGKEEIKELCAKNEEIDAERAKELGLIDEVI